MKEKSGLKAQIEKAEIIIAKVATFYGMANKDIRGKCRQRELVKARWIAMYFIRHQTDFTLKTIGDMFGRDHTTVIHALETINDIMSLKYETDLKEDLINIKRFI
jgi:chromosomal replication initiation ATPase DnaA